MPSALSNKFLRYCQQSAKTQYHSIKVGAIYCLLSPESYYYRPKEFHSKLEKSMKVGKSYDVCRRLNEYMLYFPSFIHRWRFIACYSSNILLPKQKEKIMIIGKRLSLQR